MFKITIATFVLCFVVERVFTGWKLPKVRSWGTRVVSLNAVQIAIVLIAGKTWENWFSSISIFHLSTHLSDGMAGFVAYFLATLVFYWWHRARHENDFLWRCFHQIHHSPQRLEVITSFYKHPQEMIVNSLLGCVLVYSVLGLSLGAGAIYTLFTALGEFFYHTNIKTPRWVGYIFQRPEMHRIHHQYGYHKNNYGDFVIWDMLFGTYENPVTWSNRCGFDESNELRLIDMLLLRDVHKSPSPDVSIAGVMPLLAEGDLIFLDIPSFLFRRVAECTQSWTSHVGVVFKDENGNWIVSESAIPLSRETPLESYLKRSGNGRFEIRRLKQPLSENELQQLRSAARSNLHRLYDLGFNFDSGRTFCSKHVHQTFKTIGIEVGRVESFRRLLSENPTSASVRFWRRWFFGFIPWNRQTVTPASQLTDAKFYTVLQGQRL